MSDLINIKDERFWKILFDEACVEGNQAERIEKELEQIIVEPVRGQWIPKEIMYRSPLTLNYICSQCGKANYKTNFCPHCGADMRGEKNDND